MMREMETFKREADENIRWAGRMVAVILMVAAVGLVLAVVGVINEAANAMMTLSF